MKAAPKALRIVATQGESAEDLSCEIGTPKLKAASKRKATDNKVEKASAEEWDMLSSREEAYNSQYARNRGTPSAHYWEANWDERAGNYEFNNWRTFDRNMSMGYREKGKL